MPAATLTVAVYVVAGWSWNWSMMTTPSGMRTLTEAVPTAAMSEAGMLAVSRVGFTNVVVRAAPFQRTVAPETKLLPSAVSVKAAPPAVALLGVSVVSVGGWVPPVVFQ